MSKQICPLLSRNVAVTHTVTPRVGVFVLRIQVGKQISLKEEHTADVPLCLGQI